VSKKQKNKTKIRRFGSTKFDSRSVLKPSFLRDLSYIVIMSLQRITRNIFFYELTRQEHSDELAARLFTACLDPPSRASEANREAIYHLAPYLEEQIATM